MATAVGSTTRRMATRVGVLGLRALSSSALAAQESSGANKSFLSSVLGQTQRFTAPLTQSLPGVTQVNAVPAPTEAPKTEVTTLGNGVKVATEATHSTTASIGLYVECGSVNERSGLTHMLDKLAFSSTANRSSFRITREVEGLGATIGSGAGREQMIYAIDGVRTTIPEMTEVLVDSVVNPVFNTWEVEEKRRAVLKDAAELRDNSQAMLEEAVHIAGFSGGLSNPLVAPPQALGNIDGEELAELLRAYVQYNYTGSNMVLAVSGAEHGEVLPLAEKLLESVPPTTPEVAQLLGDPSKYSGGQVLLPPVDDMNHMVLAFEFEGGYKNLQGSTMMQVLLSMLGGGGSFSAGGPGKGMHSRLYANILNNYNWVANCSYFSSVYNETGLVGVSASFFDGGDSNQLVDTLCGELESIANGKFTDEELDRAKNATISQVLYNLESKGIICEDIGRQVLLYGKRFPVSEYIADLQKVSKKDLGDFVKKMLKSKPTFAAIGNFSDRLYTDVIGKRFN
ncbi:putative subunit alpha of mitochondrial-processing peptidase [Chloropicon primus]|uniref:Putative subunit alpha of mitochondrial-processing peptidase n=1 Tax=Chloropicon primus TaxID=1764295 RepID=A0A5B8MHB2_9CHLO|nr:putative subunit alpha of mitochondrial-processing peptidase [Chloropicon primus]UPQ98883.1 putative subunit alpha of mitochondrial-processing peptidase [Chloropicon primus]|eukprot:QDZ19671.1 putative subunit alpha of mitochondrial-processing peptidase [Chloropicon primus]